MSSTSNLSSWLLAAVCFRPTPGMVPASVFSFALGLVAVSGMAAVGASAWSGCFSFGEKRPETCESCELPDSVERESCVGGGCLRGECRSFIFCCHRAVCVLRPSQPLSAFPTSPTVIFRACGVFSCVAFSVAAKLVLPNDSGWADESTPCDWPLCRGPISTGRSGLETSKSSTAPVLSIGCFADCTNFRAYFDPTGPIPDPEPGRLSMPEPPTPTPDIVEVGSFVPGCVRVLVLVFCVACGCGVVVGVSPNSERYVRFLSGLAATVATPANPSAGACDLFPFPVFPFLSGACVSPGPSYWGISCHSPSISMLFPPTISFTLSTRLR
eukprot:comp15505_c0_seq1/m.12512 comp15505_c0_seq1/g.12512  ORF comp15505_c0_seq1/g.12512 comp15505_c0_seq1/m.12512 type:complete len:327 (+) comp15505_c0_seq1:1340-2320(+)